MAQPNLHQNDEEQGFPIQLLILVIVIFGLVLYGALKVLGLF